MARKSKNGQSIFMKVLVYISFSVMVGGGLYIYKKYQHIFAPNVKLENVEARFLYIPTGSTIDDVVDILVNKGYLRDEKSFAWLAEKKNYKNHINSGRYLIKNKMNNNDLLDLLRSGKQEPVKVTFNNIRTKAQLAGKVSTYIEADSLSILSLLNDKATIAKYGFTDETMISIFIPNTYELYWNTSAEGFLKRMAKEYKAFWTADRKAKAEKLSLSQSEVSALASIVQQETVKKDERPTVAGVYLNRIKRGIRLQADPTVIFAVGDFSIRRVLKKHLNYDSPYNTYKYAGLPPGPICIPSISSIDGVLNYQKHDYIYFCAKEDFSGYHNFAKSLRQHNQNARKYQRALNTARIMK